MSKSNNDFAISKCSNNVFDFAKFYHTAFADI